MAHSERCPICHGLGKIKKYELMGFVSLTYTPEDKPKTCHGCNGRGWITVNDDDFINIKKKG